MKNWQCKRKLDENRFKHTGFDWIKHHIEAYKKICSNGIKSISKALEKLFNDYKTLISSEELEELENEIFKNLQEYLNGQLQKYLDEGNSTRDNLTAKIQYFYDFAVRRQCCSIIVIE